MNSRSLTLAIRLLTTACAGVAFGSTIGCSALFPYGDCSEPWSEVESVELGTSANILGLAQDIGYAEQFVAVGADGAVVHYDGEAATLSTPTTVDLRGVALLDGVTLVVGDAGTILSSADAGATWTARDSGIGANLVGVARGWSQTASYVVAIAAEQVIYSTDEGATWQLVTPAAGGWGGLRAVFAANKQIFVIGDGGSVWVADDPAGVWVREDLGTSDALIGGGAVSGDDRGSREVPVVVVSGSQMFYRAEDTGEWTTISSTIDGAIAASGGGFVVTVNGTIYDLQTPGRAERIANVGLAPLVIDGGDYEGLVVAGEGGNLFRAIYQDCVAGGT